MSEAKKKATLIKLRTILPIVLKPVLSLINNGTRANIDGKREIPGSNEILSGDEGQGQSTDLDINSPNNSYFGDNMILEENVHKAELCCEQNMPLFSDILQYAISKPMQRKAMGLLQYLHEHIGNTIKWNQRGQILVNGEVIPGTHIVDLVRHAVCSKTVRTPVGSDIFYKALTDVDTPSSLVATNIMHTSLSQCN